MACRRNGKVFSTCGVIFFVGWLVFTILARGEIQPWAIVSDDTDLEENVPYKKNNFPPEIEYTSSPSSPPDGGLISHRSSSSGSILKTKHTKGPSYNTSGSYDWTWRRLFSAIACKQERKRVISCMYCVYGEYFDVLSEYSDSHCHGRYRWHWVSVKLSC